MIHIHPGYVLARCIREANTNQQDLAKKIGVSRGTIHQMVSARRSMTASLAVKLGTLFGLTPQEWMRLQSDFDLWRASEGLVTPRPGRPKGPPSSPNL